MKGVSELTAAILLISIVAIVAVAITTWYLPILSGRTTNIGGQVVGAAVCSSSGLAVRDVYLINNRGVMVVENTGTIDLKLLSAQASNNAGVSVQTQTPLPLDIAKGELKALQFDASSISCSNFDRVQVQSNCQSETFASKPKNC